MGQAMIRRLILVLAVADAILASAGLMIHPVVLQEDGALGALANVLMLAFCAYVALLSPIAIQKLDTATWRFATFAGIGAGVWLGIDLVLNYFIYRDGATNQKVSFIVYGLYLAVLLVVAVRSTIMQGRFAEGITSAICYVVPAQLIWHFSEFLSFYCLSQTPGGQRFLTEEMRQDFERSGSRSLEAFTMGDIYGAGFLHILFIGFFIAVLLGSIAGLGGLGWIKLRSQIGRPAERG